MKIYIQFNRNYINKLDFINAFKPACIAALNALNIYNKFVAAGLMPYNL